MFGVRVCGGGREQVGWGRRGGGLIKEELRVFPIVEQHCHLSLRERTAASVSPAPRTTKHVDLKPSRDAASAQSISRVFKGSRQ